MPASECILTFQEAFPKRRDNLQGVGRSQRRRFILVSQFLFGLVVELFVPAHRPAAKVRMLGRVSAFQWEFGIGTSRGVARAPFGNWAETSRAGQFPSPLNNPALFLWFRNEMAIATNLSPWHSPDWAEMSAFNSAATSLSCFAIPAEGFSLRLLGRLPKPGRTGRDLCWLGDRREAGRDPGSRSGRVLPAT
jgi:hypothetical protein